MARIRADILALSVIPVKTGIHKLKASQKSGRAFLRQDFFPPAHYPCRFGNESMAAYIKPVAFIIYCLRYSAYIAGFLEYKRPYLSSLQQLESSRQARRTRTDYNSFHAHKFSPNTVLNVGWGLLLCEVTRYAARATPLFFQKLTSHSSFSLS